MVSVPARPVRLGGGLLAVRRRLGCGRAGGPPSGAAGAASCAGMVIIRPPEASPRAGSRVPSVGDTASPSRTGSPRSRISFLASSIGMRATPAPWLTQP